MLSKVQADQEDTIRKAANPGKFKDDFTCTKWEVKFENYLSTIPWVNGVPHLYIVRSQVDPGPITDFQGDFITETIFCTLISCAHFQDDTRKFHQLLNKYLVAETAQQWISSIEKRVNVRDDFDALLRHYSGEGNVNRRIAATDHL